MKSSQYLRKEKSTSSQGGVGCLTIIGIIFVVLKLLAIAPVANWSWWLVLTPFIIQIVVIVLFFALAGWLVSRATAARNRR